MSEVAIWTRRRSWPCSRRSWTRKSRCVSVIDLGIVRGFADDPPRVRSPRPIRAARRPSSSSRRSARRSTPPASTTSHIERVLFPPWTTDWISERGRQRLHAYGIAPPSRVSDRATARNADRPIPRKSAASARPHARRNGAAKPAWSRSTASNATRTIERAERRSRANARPYSRRRHAAGAASRCSSAVSSASSASSSGKQRREASPAPGAAEVEPVEMGDLAVAAVADEGGREQGRRLARRRARGRKPPNQPRNSGSWQARAPCTGPRSAPARGIRRRPAPTPGSRGRRRTSATPARGSASASVGSNSLRPFEREDQREGGVEMGADADRIGEHAADRSRSRSAKARASGSSSRRPVRSSCRDASRWRCSSQAQP